MKEEQNGELGMVSQKKNWGANWLPTTSNFGVHSPLKAEFQEAKVSSLIDPVSRFGILMLLLLPSIPRM